MNRPPPAAAPLLALLLFAAFFSNGCSDDVQPQGADLDAAPADQAALRVLLLCANIDVFTT